MSTLQKATGFLTPAPQARWVPSQKFVDDTRRGYLDALDGFAAETSTLWSVVVPQRQQDIHTALVDGSPALREMLGRPTTTNLYYGVDNLCRDLMPLGGAEVESDPGTEYLVLQLAETLGAVPFWNPVGGARYPDQPSRPHQSVDELLDALAGHLGVDLHFPAPFQGEPGLRARRGLLGFRAVNAVYQAARIKSLAGDAATASVVEIGGGMGRTALFSAMLGIGRYTIVDLPMTLVGQACFLAATMGEDSVSFAEDAASRFRLLAPQRFLQSTETFSVALNADSMTEMSQDYAEKYLAALKIRSRAFISINHEANDFSVAELMPPALRFPYILRPGYAEEYYFFGGSGQVRS